MDFFSISKSVNNILCKQRKNGINNETHDHKNKIKNTTQNNARKNRLILLQNNMVKRKVSTIQHDLLCPEVQIKMQMPDNDKNAALE